MSEFANEIIDKVNQAGCIIISLYTCIVTFLMAKSALRGWKEVLFAFPRYKVAGFTLTLSLQLIIYFVSLKFRFIYFILILLISFCLFYS